MAAVSVPCLVKPPATDSITTGNRDDPVGYKISSIAFSDGSPEQPSNSMTSTVDVLRNANVEDCPRGCFRPVGLAWGSQERLFMTSDSTGEIYVLVKSNSSATDSSPSPSSTADNTGWLVKPSLMFTTMVLAAAILAQSP